MGETFALMWGKRSLAVAVLGFMVSLSPCMVHGAGTAGSRTAFVAQGPMAGRLFGDSAACVGRPPQRLLVGDRAGGEAGGIPVRGTSRRERTGITGVSMSKKDRRYKLAKRGQSEDELLLTVAEQFRRREGQASISWYPGHIAKAEKALQDVLNRVDVVVEVRDARIPASTTHPMVDAWLQNRNTKRVVALNKVDMVPRSAVSMWEAYLENSLKIPSCLVNGKTGGKGIDQLTRLIQKAGKEINERREARGMMPRNPRVAVMGYPNVGKSGILNRLSGRSGAKVKSENKAGVTRHMQWVRTENFDLLDSPGIIPAKLVTQEVAVHLAICDDIGQASYDTTLVAAALIDEMRKVQSSMRSYCDLSGFYSKYGMGVGEYSGEEYIFRLAQAKYCGLEEVTATNILNDWRKGRLGPCALEPPPTIPYHTGYYRALGLKPDCSPSDVKRAYRDTARTKHPDMGGNVDEWQKVLTAYQVVSKEESRQMYDKYGLVWDIQQGQYRVMKPGEKLPGIEAVLDRPGSTGPRYLTGSNAIRGDAKQRKGKVQILLTGTGNKGSSIVTKRPPGPPEIVPLHKRTDDYFMAGEKGDKAIGDEE